MVVTMPQPLQWLEDCANCQLNFPHPTYASTDVQHSWPVDSYARLQINDKDSNNSNNSQQQSTTYSRPWQLCSWPKALGLEKFLSPLRFGCLAVSHWVHHCHWRSAHLSPCRWLACLAFVAHTSYGQVLVVAFGVGKVVAGAYATRWRLLGALFRCSPSQVYMLQYGTLLASKLACFTFNFTAYSSVLRA